jgi:two-component system OmpR family response regulator
MGADYYVTKPYHQHQLLATLKAVLRRPSTRTAERPATPRSRTRFAGWELDLLSRELLSPSGEELPLTTGEFDLLAAFSSNPNQVLTRDQLLDLARNRDAGPVDRTIDVQVGRLRPRSRTTRKSRR